ncbi:MAG: hypothetical protein LBS21_10000 [Clostridiales bacterium]|jgi:hypothetical protein|nr:hypothetical protein [Clostridiales bacterium]
MYNPNAPAWGEEHVKEFLRFVRKPGEKLVPEEGYLYLDDGYDFEDAVRVAVGLEEDGKILMRELMKMQDAAANS